jgi:hypothetical protein
VALHLEAAQLLDVQMDHLARRGPLVADHRRLRLQRAQLAKAQPTKDQPRRRARHAQPRGDRRPRQPLPAQALDLGQQRLWRLARTSSRRRAAVVMPSLAPETMPTQPFVTGSLGDPAFIAIGG